MYNGIRVGSMELKAISCNMCNWLHQFSISRCFCPVMYSEMDNWPHLFIVGDQLPSSDAMKRRTAINCFHCSWGNPPAILFLRKKERKNHLNTCCDPKERCSETCGQATLTLSFVNWCYQRTGFRMLKCTFCSSPVLQWEKAMKFRWWWASFKQSHLSY